MPSAREQQTARERESWKADFEQGQRTREDYQQYEQYCRETKNNGLEPLEFFEWQKLIPEEFKDAAPELRGAAASARATWNQTVILNRDTMRKHRLDDETLSGLGFDLRIRPDYEFEPLTEAILTDLFRRFQKNESRFVPKLHLQPIGDFLTRNQVSITGPHIQGAFELLLSHGIIQLPEPEPERPEGANRHGVKVKVEKDPATEARLQREKYETEIVVTDPETGREYTAFQLDRVSSDTYRRLMKIPRVTKNPALEPKH